MSDSTAPAPNNELLAFFKRLSDIDRLKIAGSLAHDPSTIEHLAVALALPPNDVSHRIARLADSGLVAGQAGGVYTFQNKVLQDLARRVPANSSPQPQFGDDDTDAFDRKVLADFLGADGRLTRLPAQCKKLLPVLRYINHIFEPGVRYDEKTVNQMLARFHEATASLRRSLVDHRFMTRQSGVYWRTDEHDL